MDYTTRRYIASDIELLQKAAATASGFAMQSTTSTNARSVQRPWRAPAFRSTAT